MIDRHVFAANLAHEICARDCFAFTGEGHQPHSEACQRAQRILVEAFELLLRDYAAVIDAHLEENRAHRKRYGHGPT